MSYKVSIVVPARNEDWLSNTVEDVLSKTGDETELRVILDGAWPVRPIADHPRLTMIHLPVSIGQRAAINLGVRSSTADYVVKMDAHVSVDQDFSNKLIQDYEPGTVVVPRLYNLHVFDFKCSACKTRTYQGPIPTICNTCKDPKAMFERILVWQPRWHKRTDFMKFDEELKFGYWGSLGERPEIQAQGDIADTMSLLGACFFMSRRHFWDLDGCDEKTGGWGQQGSEVSIKAHTYPGSRLRVNKRVWYSHLFRTSAGFSFPYSLSHQQTEHARNYSRDYWMNNRWPKQSRPLSSVVSQYWPIPGWSTEALDRLKDSEKGRKRFAAPTPNPTEFVQVNDRWYVKSAPKDSLSVGICYYTENGCPEPIFTTVQEQISRVANGHQIVSVSLKPLPNFGDNIVLGLERGWLTMAQQILAGLSLLDTDVVFMAEHDVLYGKDYFSSFIPPDRSKIYYNENVWRVRSDTGEALFTYHKSVSQMCGDRRVLIDHYRERIARIEKEGFRFRMGFEPGTKSLKNGGFDDLRSESWWAPTPNIDIWHGKNATRCMWEKTDYRNEKFTFGWDKRPSVPGWPDPIMGRFPEFLEDIRLGNVK